MEKVLLSYHCTVKGFRKAIRLQTLFRENGYSSRIEEIIERIMDETPKGYGRYMVLVSNPGIENDVFQQKCEQIFKDSNLG